MRQVLKSAIVVLALAGVGCQPGHAAEADSRSSSSSSDDAAPSENAAKKSPAPAPEKTQFSGPGVKLEYPGKWSRVDSKEYALLLAPTGDAAKQSVSLEIPKLPPHVPGMIPLGSVVKGYIDDMKKQHPGVKVETPANETVAKSAARRVKSTWDEKGQTLVEEAVLTVHGDHVYIFRDNGNKDHCDAASKSLGEVMSSVQWK
jgi:hypothetical protein